jgi:hypothetical protein
MEAEDQDEERRHEGTAANARQSDKNADQKARDDIGGRYAKVNDLRHSPTPDLAVSYAGQSCNVNKPTLDRGTLAAEIWMRIVASAGRCIGGV